MKTLVRIKLNSNEDNKAKGFYLLATNGNTFSPKKDEFVVSKNAISLLKENKVNFEQVPLKA